MEIRPLPRHAVLHRVPPSYLVNDARAASIGVRRWQVDHIRQGLRETKAGKFVGQAKVRRTLARLTHK